MDAKSPREDVRNALLLKEYELCQQTAQSLEAPIWQTSAMIGIGSLGALVAVVYERPRWLLAFTIGLFVAVANWVWWRMARRWWSIQHAKHCRMLHIEQDLTVLHQTRYLHYLDDLHHPDFPLQKMTEEQQEARRKGLREEYDITVEQAGDLERLSHQRSGVQVFVQCFQVVSAVGWVLYLTVDLFYRLLDLICGHGPT